MTRLEPAPQQVNDQIRRMLRLGEQQLIRVTSDIQDDGTFGTRWIVVTSERLLIISQPDWPPTEIPLQQVAGVRAEALVGGGFFEIARHFSEPVRITYSASRSLLFSELAAAIVRIRKGEPFIPLPQLDRVRCPNCDRLLPEKNGICPACIKRLATFRRIARYIAPYKGRMLILALASLVTTGAGLFPPMITRWIIDDVLRPANRNASDLDRSLAVLGLLVLALVLLRIVSFAAEWVHGWNAAWLGARITADIRSQLYRHMEMLSLRFYDKREIGALMSHVSNDSGTLQDFLIRGLPLVLTNTCTFFGIFAFMLSMNWQVALIVALPVPGIWIWGLLFWRRMAGLFQRWWQAGARFSAQLSESLSGIRVTRAFAAEGRAIRRFQRINTELLHINVDTNRSRAMLLATMGVITGVGVLSLWLFGGWKVIRGEMSLGTLLAFYSYVLLLYGPLQWFGQVSTWMTQAFTGATRIFEILDMTSEAHEDPEAMPLEKAEGRVAFRELRFGYEPGKPVLHDIAFEAAPGELIGLIGKSGAGKTTLMHLLCRFYDPDGGAIEIDGVNIRKLRLRDLRDQIGIVLQEPFLFAGTIAENISYGRPGASFEEIMQAARASNAHSFILNKPDGYDTDVGERGNRLSGGEKQRIAIARAILRNPGILILDEATSSVDALSERLIQEGISTLAHNRTTFVIAHRLSTLRNADRLVVLEQGRVLESGTYEELLARRGLFSALVQLQQELPQNGVAAGWS